MSEFGRVKKIEDLRDESHKPLQTKVFEALGAASSCWVDVPDETGKIEHVFDSTRATEIGNQLMSDILDVVRSEWESVQESDIGRQRQIHNQRELIDMCQKKFVRILQILDGYSSNNAKGGMIRSAVTANASEVSTW